MNENNYNPEIWESDSYETGSTQPPKSRGGLIALLLVLVILLCGASSALGVLNIRLEMQLQQLSEPNVPIQFHPPATANQNSYETEDAAPCRIPGVEGRTFSVAEQSFYRWPAGFLVTKVLSGSAADAGLMIGDIITQVNDRAITDAASMDTALEALSPETALRITLCRDGEYHTLEFLLENSK